MRSWLLCLPLLAAVSAVQSDSGGGRWKVSLAWSPEFCHDSHESSREMQCTDPHAFVLGGFEQVRESGEAQRCGKNFQDVSDDVMERMLGVMWNKVVIKDEWRQHGSCSGLGMMEFFVQADFLARKIAIPEVYTRSFGTLETTAEQVRRRFVEANAGLDQDALLLRCDREWLREVEVCVDKDLNYQACMVQPADTCRASIKLRGVNQRLRQPDYSGATS
jgi:ribonuclease T2